MKKYILGFIAFAFVTIITLSVTSCNEDEDNVSSLIVGKWKWNDGEIWVFEADGTGYIDDDGKGSQIEYVYKNKYLDIYIEDEDEHVVARVEVVNNDLLYLYEEEDGEIDKSVLRRIK